VPAVVYETAQPLGGLGDRVRTRDADRIEAVLARSGGERALDRVSVGQKSRSA
jgi:hypothetical protein